MNSGQGLTAGSCADILPRALFHNIFVSVLNIPVKEVLTCSVCQRVSWLEKLLFCWSPNRSSFPMVSQSGNGLSLCERLDQPHQQISQFTDVFIAQTAIYVL